MWFPVNSSSDLARSPPSSSRRSSCSPRSPQRSSGWKPPQRFCNSSWRWGASEDRSGGDKPVNSGHCFGFFKAQVAIFEQELNRQKTSYLNEKDVQNGKIFCSNPFSDFRFREMAGGPRKYLLPKYFFLDWIKIQNPKYETLWRTPMSV